LYFELTDTAFRYSKDVIDDYTADNNYSFRKRDNTEMPGYTKTDFRIVVNEINSDEKNLKKKLCNNKMLETK